MKPFRIRIEVDIAARDREQAERGAGLLYSDLEHGRRPWVHRFLPRPSEGSGDEPQPPMATKMTSLHSQAAARLLSIPLPVRCQGLSSFCPLWPRHQAASLTRTYSLGRPPQRDKPLSRTFDFSKE